MMRRSRFFPVALNDSHCVITMCLGDFDYKYPSHTFQISLLHLHLLSLEISSMSSHTLQPNLHLPKKMSSFGGFFSGKDLFKEDNPVSSPAFRGEDQLAGVFQEGEASATNEAMVTGDIPPNMEYACGLRSDYMVANKLFLRHNYDIPPFMRLHFPGTNQDVFLEPGFGDISP
jgi:hypothetical protein